MRSIVMKAGKFLLSVARLRPLGNAIGFCFEHFPFILRFAYILEDDYFVAFRHPVPVRSGHILMIPKKRLVSSPDFLSESGNIITIFTFLKKIENRLGYKELSVSTNIGCRQEVKQVHFHLLPSDAPFERSKKEPDAVFEIGRGQIKQIRSGPSLESLEICYKRDTEEGVLQEAFAEIIRLTSSVVEAALGATIFMYFSALEGRTLTAHPTLRIVIEDPKGGLSITSILPKLNVL